jgi:hypothetical protein
MFSFSLCSIIFSLFILPIYIYNIERCKRVINRETFTIPTLSTRISKMEVTKTEVTKMEVTKMEVTKMEVTEQAKTEVSKMEQSNTDTVPNSSTYPKLTDMLLDKKVCSHTNDIVNIRGEDICIRCCMIVGKPIMNSIHGAIYFCTIRGGLYTFLSELSGIKDPLRYAAKFTYTQIRDDRKTRGVMEDPLKDVMYRSYLHKAYVKERGDQSSWHPLILRTFISFHRNDLEVSISERMDGDLFSFVERRVLLDRDQLISIMRDMSLALEFSHRHSVAHRDVSLENFLYRDGKVVLSDFGLACDTRSSSKLSVQNGKFMYFSPERKAGAHFDPIQDDVFALGICFFVLNLRVGLSDHQYRCHFETDSRVLKTPYYVLKGFEMDQDQLDLVRHMLVADPKKRFTMEQVLDHKFFQ